MLPSMSGGRSVVPGTVFLDARDDGLRESRRLLLCRQHLLAQPAGGSLRATSVGTSDANTE
jgi:hypothetical protein